MNVYSDEFFKSLTTPRLLALYRAKRKAHNVALAAYFAPDQEWVDESAAQLSRMKAELNSRENV